MTKTHNTNEQPNETKFKEATLQIYGSVLINKSWYPTLQQSEKTFKHSMKCVISTSNLSAITLPTVNIRFNVPYFFTNIMAQTMQILDWTTISSVFSHGVYSHQQ